VAGPAPGIGRQAQGPGLLLTLALAACANTGEPPGGPPDTAPPSVVAVRPESGSVVQELRGDAVVQFDEVIEEMAGGGGGGGAAAVSGLARQLVLSPVAGNVKASWHRTAIHVRPVEGWKPGRVYRLELLPGIQDLRRNVLKEAKVVIFSTGPAIGHAVLAGTALQWVEQRALAGAVIRAARLPDTVAYVTIADSTGDFRLTNLQPGRYLIYALQDQNGNRALDRREAFDSTSVTLDTAGHVVLWTFVHDTAGPRLRSADPLDSVTVRLSFSQALDPAAAHDAARVRVFALPDTTPLTVAAVLTPAVYDSLAARERARADSVRRAADTTARRDTTAQRAPRPPGAAAADTSRIRKILRQRPIPFDRLLVRMRQPLAPGSKYLIRVQGATNLSGASADGQAVLAIPVPRRP
jgi:Big-like domain-containing protein